MEFLKNGHEKLWENHGISFHDLRGNPGQLRMNSKMVASYVVLNFEIKLPSSQ